MLKIKKMKTEQIEMIECPDCEGETFEEACIKKIGHMLDKDENKPDGYRRFGGKLCVWACCCFDNEKEARESFG
jgi:hypothetical protein